MAKWLLSVLEAPSQHGVTDRQGDPPVLESHSPLPWSSSQCAAPNHLAGGLALVVRAEAISQPVKAT